MYEEKQPCPERKKITAGLLETELKRLWRRDRFFRAVRSTASTFAIVAAIAVLISTMFLPVLRIYGASMAPTLHEGEIVVAARTDRMDRGKLVAFYYGNKVLIKRCIGLPGEEIDIDSNGRVFVNGAFLDEPYLQQADLGECDIRLPYQVPEGRYFVLGDQRASSVDSRNSLVGCVASEQIIGTIALRLWPLDRFGIVAG